MNTKFFKANGLKFGYLEMGSRPLVLALHGFPDTPYAFRHQTVALAAAGYRVGISHMHGYFPTDTPPDAPYEAAALAQDTLALINMLAIRS